MADRNEQSLVKPSSGSNALTKPPNVSEKSFSLVLTWVTAVCHNKRMETPNDATFELTWIQPLSIYPPSVVDEAFRDYLQNGAGEFFDTHAITGRCNQIRARRESENRMGAGCDECEWTGWIASETQPKALRRCACFFDPKLRTDKPTVERMDLGDVRDELMRKFENRNAMPKGKSNQP